MIKTKNKMGNWKNKFLSKRPASCSPLRATYNEKDGGPGGPGSKTTTTTSTNEKGDLEIKRTTTTPGSTKPKGLPGKREVWDNNVKGVQEKYSSFEEFEKAADAYNNKKYGKSTTTTETETLEKVPSRGPQPIEVERTPRTVKGVETSTNDGDDDKEKKEDKKKETTKKKVSKKKKYKPTKKKKIKYKKKKTKAQYNKKSSTACTFDGKC
jgi:hypothetical protein